jgi:hypothetical protein
VKIHRSNPAKGFTKIPNKTACDPRLSYQARGLLTELLSRPDDWETTADAIWARARRERDKPGEGRDRIRADFAELESAGYLRRERKRGPRGRIVTELHIYDNPVNRTDDSADSYWSDSDKYISLQAAPAADYQAPADQAPADQAPNGNSLSRSIAMLLRVPGATEKEAEEVVRQLEADPNVTYPGPYLRKAIRRGDAADLMIGARKRLAERDGMGQASSKRPDWCGNCDERTRMIGEDQPRRCPDCHA